MPGPVSLRAPLNLTLEVVTGDVTALTATADSSMEELGIGGIIDIGRASYYCPSAHTCAMLTVAADARQAGRPVSVRFWTSENLINDITS